LVAVVPAVFSLPVPLAAVLSLPGPRPVLSTIVVAVPPLALWRRGFLGRLTPRLQLLELVLQLFHAALRDKELFSSSAD
jgi:hypothetical protein